MKSVSTWKRGHNRIVNLPNIWYGNCYINGIAIDEKKRNIFWILVHLFIGIRRKIWQYLLLKPSCVRPGMDQPIPCVSRSNAQCSTAQGQKPIFFFFTSLFLRPNSFDHIVLPRLKIFAAAQILIHAKEKWSIERVYSVFIWINKEVRTAATAARKKNVLFLIWLEVQCTIHIRTSAIEREGETVGNCCWFGGYMPRSATT